MRPPLNVAFVIAGFRNYQTVARDGSLRNGKNYCHTAATPISAFFLLLLRNKRGHCRCAPRRKYLSPSSLCLPSIDGATQTPRQKFCQPFLSFAAPPPSPFRTPPEEKATNGNCGRGKNWKTIRRFLSELTEHIYMPQQPEKSSHHKCHCDYTIGIIC